LKWPSLSLTSPLMLCKALGGKVNRLPHYLTIYFWGNSEFFYFWQMIKFRNFEFICAIIGPKWNRRGEKIPKNVAQYRGQFFTITLVGAMRGSILLDHFFFHFLWSAKVVILNVIVVLQILTFIYIIDTNYHINSYYISIILFSSIISWFHPRFFINLKFFGNFIQDSTFSIMFYRLNIGPITLVQDSILSVMFEGRHVW